MKDSKSRYRPWRTPEFDSFADEYLFQFGYIVVDEKSGDGADQTVSLIIATWPIVDELGRISFSKRPGRNESLQVSASAQLFQDVVSRREVSNDIIEDIAVSAFRERPLTVGDVFAAEINFEQLREWNELVERIETSDEPLGYEAFLDPKNWDWFTAQPIFDITASARRAARVAASSAVVRNLDNAGAADLLTPPQDQSPDDDPSQSRSTGTERGAARAIEDEIATDHEAARRRLGQRNN